MKTGMFRDALFIARMGVRHLLGVREVLFWTFLMPVVFFYFFGTVMRNTGGSRDVKDTLAVSAPADAGFLADQLIERLGRRDYQVVRVQSQEEFVRHRRRLEIPAGFTDSVLAGKPMKIRFSRTGEDMNADYDRVRLARAVYTELADLVVLTQNGGAATPAAFAKLAAEPRALEMEVKTAGKRPDPPSGFEQAVPGTMVMFTLLVLFTSGAVTITIERNQGILRRLASAPMSRGAIVLGKWASRLTLGMVQIVFAMTTGTVLFGIRWGPNVLMVLLVMLAYGALAAALGLLLGNFGGSEGKVIGMGVIASNLLAGLGGCWWPIEVTPLWAQKLALFLPTGWAMDAMHKLVNFGASPVAVIPHVCVLAMAAVAAGYAVARSFRFE